MSFYESRLDPWLLPRPVEVVKFLLLRMLPISDEILHELVAPLSRSYYSTLCDGIELKSTRNEVRYPTVTVNAVLAVQFVSPQPDYL